MGHRGEQPRGVRFSRIPIMTGLTLTPGLGAGGRRSISDHDRSRADEVLLGGAVAVVDSGVPERSDRDPERCAAPRVGFGLLHPAAVGWPLR